MASSPNKISNKQSLPETERKSDSFNRWVGYSAIFHTAIVLTILAFNKFEISIWKKPPPVSTVVWTQTVKRAKPMPDKLPPPIVAPKKVEEPKKDEINIKKQPAPEKKQPEESNKDKMKRALEALRKNMKDDDRPTPREDNFPTQDEKKPEGVLSDQQMLALQASSIYSAYQQAIKETVTSNFIWYKAGTNLNAKVSMKIDPKGNVINPKIEKSSGDPSYDQATLRAIEKSNPLPPPPPELVQMFMQEPVEINFERKE